MHCVTENRKKHLNLGDRHAVVLRAFQILRAHLGIRSNHAHSFLQLCCSPITIAAITLFVVVLGVIAVVTFRSARTTAERQLKSAAANIVDSLDECVSKQLAFIGRTICDIYRTPENMVGVDMKALLDVYGVDELNAIDGNGFIVASMLPIVGDNQWKKLNPAKFNKALLKDGQNIFSQCFRPSADEPGVYYKYVGIAFPPPAKGYLQLGLKRIRLQDSIDYTLRDLVTHWRVGQDGFYIISKTANGLILSCGLEGCRDRTLADVGFDVFEAHRRQNVERRDPISQTFYGFQDVKFFVSSVKGVKCLCTSGVVNQFHRYVAAIPLSDIYDDVVMTVGLTAAMLFIVMVIVVFFLSRLSNYVVKLRGYIAREKLATKRDLEMAKTIQVSSLPVVFPNEATYRVDAKMDTAKEVGGDFFDFYSVPSGRLFFLIADVSGKGIPAAMFMMKAKAIIKSCAVEFSDFAEAIRVANLRLTEGNDAQMFVTVWFGLFNSATGEVEYVNAGHNPPLVKRADGSVEWLRQRGGPALAATDLAKFRSGKMTLRPGDSLFLYTDGVTEAMNEQGELYGEQRLERVLAAADTEWILRVREDVARFVADAEQSDDITMLAIDLKSVSGTSTNAK